jgi:DNA repair protein RadC
LRELPADEQPRERLSAHGPAALSDSELVALLVRTGTRDASALELSRQLLRETGGLAGLALERGTPAAVPGVGPAKWSALHAAVEIGRRLARAQLPEREVLGRPETVARYLRLRYATSGQEVMGALYFDTRNGIVHEQEVFRGTLNRAAVEPRALLKVGLIENAASLLVFHTHPSGDPTPSVEDLAFTRRLREAAELLGLRLLDHLILGHGGRWLSLRQSGQW